MKNQSYKKLRPRKAKVHTKNKVQVTTVLPIPHFFKSHRKGISVVTTKRHHSKADFVNRYLPRNLQYMVTHPESPFNLKSIRKDQSSHSNNGVVHIPELFSIIDNPGPSFTALRQIVSALLIEPTSIVTFDYSACSKIDIGTQAIMDMVLMEYDQFINKSLKINRYDAIHTLPKGFEGKNITKDEIKKIIFSIGSPAILGIREADFKDVIKNKMCSHCMLSAKDKSMLTMQKEIDTTLMVDYVVKCLRKMNKELTPKKLHDLSTVFGEILINAEEHSTLSHRFSVGYFYEVTETGKHYGMLNLVILNFGSTIYETFKNNRNCPVEVVDRMKSLSESYTNKHFFSSKKFEEETLWTLYALQQGVTSVAGQKRGSGTIQFIRSFFNIKGNLDVDNVSRMTIRSGNTQILFDGKYGITEKNDGNERYNMMTFNDSGNIEDMPDKKYVSYTDTYFPGTIISANILLNDDDVKEIS